jgi:pseudouridylate synthase I
MMILRYKLLIEYDGTGYVGWQKQPGHPSIQQAIETAIFKFCQAEVEVYGSGRTDAGVHALGQVAHVDLAKEFDLYKMRQALNFYLHPNRIAILEVQRRPAPFHARFSAIKRRYIYRMVARSAPLALDFNKAWHVYRPLSIAAMQAAAPYLLGHHDFSSFRASECQAASPMKTVDKIAITQQGDIIEFFVEAKSFLHHQVRNMVGSLKLVGEGKWTSLDLKAALEACDRRKGGPTAPACGLYFHSVDYEDQEG